MPCQILQEDGTISQMVQDIQAPVSHLFFHSFDKCLRTSYLLGTVVTEEFCCQDKEYGSSSLLHKESCSASKGQLYRHGVVLHIDEVEDQTLKGNTLGQCATFAAKPKSKKIFKAKNPSCKKIRQESQSVLLGPKQSRCVYRWQSCRGRTDPGTGRHLGGVGPWGGCFVALRQEESLVLLRNRWCCLSIQITQGNKLSLFFLDVCIRT